MDPVTYVVTTVAGSVLGSLAAKDASRASDTMRRYFTTEVNPDYLSNELKAMKSLHQMFKAAYLAQPVLRRWRLVRRVRQ